MDAEIAGGINEDRGPFLEEIDGTGVLYVFPHLIEADVDSQGLLRIDCPEHGVKDVPGRMPVCEGFGIYQNIFAVLDEIFLKIKKHASIGFHQAFQMIGNVHQTLFTLSVIAVALMHIGTGRSKQQRHTNEDGKDHGKPKQQIALSLHNALSSLQPLT